MKIIIAGAGEVGFQLAKVLAQEEHDIILIDKNVKRLRQAESHLDVAVMEGNAVSIQLLESAGVASTDLLIAATSSEETNITAAIIGKHLGAKRTIVRISNPEFQTEKDKVNMHALGIDAMVFPEALAAGEIVRLVKRAGVTDTFEFGEGKLVLTGLILEKMAPLVGKSILDAVQANRDIRFTVVAIQRDEKTLIPRGDSVFQAQDKVFFISRPNCVPHIETLSGKDPLDVKHIMILGGSLIGEEFAQRVESQYKVKLIDYKEEKCFKLADKLSKTLVIQGDGSNVELLEEEGISEMDAFVAVTGNSETNIISCLVAKNHGVKRTIALVENIDYISLSQNVGIDTLINKKMIAINNIFRHIRAGQVESLTSIHGVESEFLEFAIQDPCKIVGIPVKDINFPRDAVIAGIIRGEHGYIAHGKTKVKVGDKVVVFTLSGAVHKVEKFFE